MRNFLLISNGDYFGSDKEVSAGKAESAWEFIKGSFFGEDKDAVEEFLEDSGRKDKEMKGMSDKDLAKTLENLFMGDGEATRTLLDITDPNNPKILA